MTVQKHPLVVSVSEIRFDEKLPEHFNQAERKGGFGRFEPAAYPPLYVQKLDSIQNKEEKAREKREKR